MHSIESSIEITIMGSRGGVKDFDKLLTAFIEVANRNIASLEERNIASLEEKKTMISQSQ